MKKKELRVEKMRGKGPGGQHKNKTESAVRITHIPTGISAYADERSQKHSYRKAYSDLESKLEKSRERDKADRKKKDRDFRIKNQETIRTYDFKSGVVKDHRTGKRASLKEVLRKGNLDLLK